jgi:hypothetical protein
MAILNSIHQQVENQAADIAMLKVSSLQSEDDPEDILRESLADLYGTNSPKIPKRLPPQYISQDVRAKEHTLRWSDADYRNDPKDGAKPPYFHHPGSQRRESFMDHQRTEMHRY